VVEKQLHPEEHQDTVEQEPQSGWGFSSFLNTVKHHVTLYALL
jgi:hypothetical protein